jgi:uncharacterized repeat protein (TIGR03987 family)
MDASLLFAIVAMFTALAFYTIGVWAEKFAGTLKGWHLIFFWLGLLFDTLGTNQMFKIAGGVLWNLHGITGLAAITLMFIHAIWASWVLYRKNEEAAAKFHRFSIFVWTMWLIPFISGLILVMA